MRLDTAFLDQPAEHRSGAVGRIGDQPFEPETEPVQALGDAALHGRLKDMPQQVAVAITSMYYPLGDA